jgi:hypothetical protein
LATVRQLSQALRMPSPSVSTPEAFSSIWPLQLSSMPLQVSGAPGWTAGFVSLQSPETVLQPAGESQT